MAPQFGQFAGGLSHPLWLSREVCQQHWRAPNGFLLARPYGLATVRTVTEVAPKALVQLALKIPLFPGNTAKEIEAKRSEFGERVTCEMRFRQIDKGR